ncbi:MAG: family 4 glycosyl hydrolase [Acidimicrobiales bacterium]
MKLAVLGGGGVRIPALVRAVLSRGASLFDRIDLFEPDAERRASIGRLSVEIGAALGHRDVVSVTDDVEAALTGSDYVFSAIRVGGDKGRIIDEETALERGLVGQETTGPGGCAMALRTIPVVLRYCETLSRVAPGAVLVNFTNPAGIVTEAITRHSDVRAVGICDTPSETLDRLSEYVLAGGEQFSYRYGGLNHLGWVSSVVVDGKELLDELLFSYEDLRAFNPCFAAFDAAYVRRIGAIPTEYLYYFYEPAGYVCGLGRAGTTRGAMVRRFNEIVIKEVGSAFAHGSFPDAWAAYSRVMQLRSATYMRLDVDGEEAGLGELVVGDHDLQMEPQAIGGYEGVALRVIDGLMGRRPDRIVVNTRNGSSLAFLDPDDIVEVPALVDENGVSPLLPGDLPPGPRGLALQVKEYEKAVVEAAVTGDANLAATALALHPLVPGMSVAKDLVAAYRERHGPHLAYLG